MPYVVYSTENLTSANIGAALIELYGFKEAGAVGGLRHFRHGGIDLLEIKTDLLRSEFLGDILDTDVIVFACSHTSSKEVASFTAHSEGNWSGRADMGGMPRQLSVASPLNVIDLLSRIKMDGRADLPVLYEATHHGPLLKIPSLFVEVGGNAEAKRSPVYAGVVAKAIFESLAEKKRDPRTTVVGFGGLHYAEKFTKVAFEKGYAFSHIMPKYYVGETDMMGQAVERSSREVEKAVIEWKSMGAEDRNKKVSGLNRMGIDYERV